MREAEAREDAARRHELLPKSASPGTYEKRYEKAIDTLAGLAKQLEGNRLIVHVVGVGGLRGPQVREVLRALKEKTGKTIEMHLTDNDVGLLKTAAEAARKEFPDADISAHNVDIADPRALPASRAHLTICTNVLSNILYPSNHVGLHYLASSVREGGYLLLSESDTDKILPELNDYGLHMNGSVEEPPGRSSSPRFSVIFRKAHEQKPFHEIWRQVKEAEEPEGNAVRGRRPKPYKEERG
jgi:hypothetical protein